MGFFEKQAGKLWWNGFYSTILGIQVRVKRGIFLPKDLNYLAEARLLMGQAKLKALSSKSVEEAKKKEQALYFDALDALLAILVVHHNERKHSAVYDETVALLIRDSEEKVRLWLKQKLQCPG